MIMLLIQQTAAQSVGLDATHAPDALLSRIAAIPSMATGSRRLVMLLTQLGDFDSMDWGCSAPTVAYLCLPNPEGTPRGSIWLLDEFYVAASTAGAQRLVISKLLGAGCIAPGR